jgi:HAD superfamily hydrolase (TIGR01509 family)
MSARLSHLEQTASAARLGVSSMSGIVDMGLPRMPQGVVFDMDGLIFDTETTYRDALMATAADLGHRLPEDFFFALIGLPSEVALPLWHAEFGPDIDIDAFLAEARRRFHARVEAGDLLKPGVVELLDTIGSLSIPHAIATSSKRDTVEHHLAAHGLTNRFPVIVAHGDYARGKPNPDPFLLAAERLHLPPEACIALEDSHNGVRAAASAGMMTVMVPDLLEATDEIRKLCVHVARDLHEIRGMVKAA